jgi:hypothetical protein
MADHSIPFHPIVEVYPRMPADEFAALATDIHAKGLLVPILLHPDGRIVDGRHRYLACVQAGVEPRFDTWDGIGSLADLVQRHNGLRRHLTPSQKAAVAVELEPFYAAEAKARQATSTGGAKPQLKAIVPQAGKRQARDEAAKATGASPRYTQDAKAIKTASPEVFEKVKQGTVTVSRAKKEVRAAQNAADLVTAQAAVTDAKRADLATVCDLRACSCAALFASGIRPDAVITDPPYPREFLPVFSDLAEACAMAHVPLVAVMSGQSYLPEVMARLCAHLEYRWTVAYLTPGGQAVQQWEAKVNAAWKPVLVFGSSREWFGDVAVSTPNDNDKRFHGWGQSESGMADLVERLTQPGQLICDPFLGGGTTAVVSLALGRRFVGCDIDPAAVETTRRRIEVMP